MALACPDEYRDVSVLIIEDNLVTYRWISTRMELDPDQLHPYKPAPKKSKPDSGEPLAEAEEGVAAPPKKANSSGQLKRKKAASSIPKSAATFILSTTEEAKEEASSL